MTNERDEEDNGLYCGTTIGVLKNIVGTYIVTDGYATKVISEEKHKENEKLGRKPGPDYTSSQKAVKIGENLYAARSGCTGWTIPIIRQLQKRVQSENLTTHDCAEHAAREYRNENYKLPINWRPIKNFDIKKQSCGITFASYNVANPTVVFAGRSTSGHVTIKEVVDPNAQQVANPSAHNHVLTHPDEVTYNCHGTGAPFARKILSKYVRKINRGLNTESHGMILLKALRYACKKDPHSGGLIRVVLLTENGAIEMYKEQEKDLKEILNYYKYRQRLKRRRERQQVQQWLKVCKPVKRHKFHLERQKFES